ncbi:MAG: DNA-processing protein DprA [Bacteroidales bacterium]|nr:DNA-processing protein DprA [Bacteroidales bacterium]
MNDDTLYAVALNMLPHVGATSARLLMGFYRTAKEVFSLSRGELNRIFGKRDDVIEAIANGEVLRRAEAELQFAEKKHIRVLLHSDDDFPRRLNEDDCVDAPTVLFYAGKANLNATRALAVVGTRKATSYGQDVVARLLADLAKEEVLVVSGLALGIDTCAHTFSMKNGLPTVAVVAHGLDRIYPPLNRNLAARMLQEDAGIITEYPSGTPISPGQFPARNRIIAGMVDGVLVVEASATGGALITANLAAGYHREVLAVPGRIGDKYSEGCNRIIANSKALLVESGDDVLHALGWERRSTRVQQQKLPLQLSADEEKIMAVLRGQDEVTMNEIIAKSGLPIATLSSLLFELELKSLCRCLPGRKYKML